MDKKKVLLQIVAAIVLFTVIKVILDKTYTIENILNQLSTGLIFGLIYGVFIVAKSKFRDKK